MTSTSFISAAFQQAERGRVPRPPKRRSCWSEHFSFSSRDRRDTSIRARGGFNVFDQKAAGEKYYRWDAELLELWGEMEGGGGGMWRRERKRGRGFKDGRRKAWENRADSASFQRREYFIQKHQDFFTYKVLCFYMWVCRWALERTHISRHKKQAPSSGRAALKATRPHTSTTEQVDGQWLPKRHVTDGQAYRTFVITGLTLWHGCSLVWFRCQNFLVRFRKR